MIGYLKGKVKRLTPGYVLMEVNGVGYEVVCSGAAFSRLAGVKPGEDGEVYTFLRISESDVTLFGFVDPREKELFLRLTSVQSVGAAKAIAILSSMRPEDVSEAIATADVKRLSAAKGVGKKMAERIILELHGKISADELLGTESVGGRVSAVPMSEDDDAVSALMNLGFTKQESAQAVTKAKARGAKTVEEIISLALRGM